MLDYARLDTHYLLGMRDRLASELQSGGHWEEADELFKLLNDTPPAQSAFDPDGYWSMSQAHHLGGRQAALLRELYLWREDQAAKQDRPPFKVMGDAELVAIAVANPGDPDQLRAIRGISPRQADRYGQAVMQALVQGRGAPVPRRPAPKRTDQPTRERFEALRDWRKVVAQKRGVDSDVILPREFLWAIARAQPRSKADLSRVLDRLPWRCEAYGQAILEVLGA